MGNLNLIHSQKLKMRNELIDELKLNKTQITLLKKWFKTKVFECSAAVKLSKLEWEEITANYKKSYENHAMNLLAAEIQNGKLFSMQEFSVPNGVQQTYTTLVLSEK